MNQVQGSHLRPAVTPVRGTRLVPAGVVLVAGAGLAWLLWLSFVQVFVVQWNAPRLAPAAALVRGLAIYGMADHGPFFGWGYGPVFPLVFGLVAWLPDQVSLHAAAWLLNVVVAAGPVWLAARCGARRPAAGAALLVGGLLALGTGLGRASLTFIHVDLVCCGFGALACVAVARGTAGGARGWIVVAAAASVLATGTKQIAVVLFAGLAAWMWTAGHRREMARYLAWSAGLGLVAAVAAVLAFGRAPLVFNLWTMHRHNPRMPDFAEQLVARFGGLALELGPVVLAGWLIRCGRPVKAAPLADRVEAALLWVALGHLPLGLLAAAKVAGGLNSVHTFHYLGVLFVVRLARVLAGPAAPGRLGRGLLVVAALLACVQGWRAHRREGLPFVPAVQRLRDEEALARREPGRVYFPWNPLVTVLTDRQARPFDDALLCLDRCGLPADRAAVLAGIPPGALVVYPDPVQSMFALRFLQGPRP